MGTSSAALAARDDRCAPRVARSRWRAALVALSLAGLAVWFVASAAPRLTAPFGDSHDGRNAAQWGLGSRALREDGLIESRLGARLQDGTEYTHHPPLILWLTASAEQLGGERPLASRAPAWLASIGAICLLYHVLREAGVRDLAALGATAVATTTPMFSVYGGMLDTPMVSLPFGLAALLVWLRGLHAKPASRALILAVAATACLAGWQATLLVGAIGVVEAHRTWHDAAERRRAVAWIVGLVVGVGLTMAWIAWGSGGFGGLWAAAVARGGSASGSGGLADVMDRQAIWLRDLLGPAVLAMPLAAAAAVLDQRLRPVASLALVVVGVYTIGFAGGAVHHDYWAYWIVVPIAVGAAFAFDQVLMRFTPSIGIAACAAVVLALVLSMQWRASAAEDEVVHGADAGQLLVDARIPNGQRTLGLIGVINPPATWVPYISGLEPVQLDDAGLRSLETEHPDDLVLVSSWCEDRAAGDACRRYWGHQTTGILGRHFALVPAADLSERPSAALRGR